MVPVFLITTPHSLRYLVDLPKLCACGRQIKFSNEDRCEECFCEETIRFHGRSQRIKSLPWLEGESNDQVQER